MVRPGISELREIAAWSFLDVDDDELEALHGVVQESWKYLDRLDSIDPRRREIAGAGERNWHRPSDTENPNGTFITKCEVPVSAAGRLSGKRVGLKDSISLAGVPMTNGSQLLADFIPASDATVVKRILAEGGSIVGKLNMDEFAMAGTGEDSGFWPVRNPHSPSRCAGGSSSGCGAAIAADEVDLALGVDQGGSARIPAAWTGTVALKATHGAVPSFGTVYLDFTLDHICPMARTTSEVEELFEVIRGFDDASPNMQPGIQTDESAPANRSGGLRLGVITESLDWDDVAPEMVAAISEATEQLESMGHEVTTVSLPWWKDAWPVWYGLSVHSIAAMVQSDFEGYWHLAEVEPDRQQALGVALRKKGVHPRLQSLILLGEYLRRSTSGHYFAKAQQLRRDYTADTDALFEKYDVLITPTTPMLPFPRSGSSISVEDSVARGPSMSGNTYPTNLTGHPSLSVPWSTSSEGLPRGLQLIGRHWEEQTLFDLGKQLEVPTGARR